jgi:xanthine/CO dehydrogenase XdhC/CoxF family maturation factor
MEDIRLHVRPAGDGWLVDAAGAIEPLVFRSGGRAEAQAHALARTLATSGQSARVLVHDRAQQIVGSTSYAPREGPIG